MKLDNIMFLQVLVQLVKKHGSRTHLFDLTLEECDYLYSRGIYTEKLNTTTYPVFYKLTLEK